MDSDWMNGLHSQTNDFQTNYILKGKNAIN